MKAIQPYLFFNGNCREAMEFYAAAFGSTLTLMTYSEGPNPPAEGGDCVMHANIGTGFAALMASDPMPGQTLAQGKNFGVSIACESRAEEERLFAALSEGDQLLQPLQDTFWGAYFGMFYDRFGVTWMLSHQADMA